jgi:galactokinase/galacturonokinase
MERPTDQQIRPAESRPGSERARVLVDRLRAGAAGAASDLFVVETPLRICPIGAHVDHQGGVVTGMTIDRQVVMAAAADPTTIFSLTSLEFPGEVTIDLRTSAPARTGDWGDHARAAVAVLGDRNRLGRGLRAVISGDLPGAGLSSSAAVLVSYFLGLARVNDLKLDRSQLSALVQRAENEFIGVKSGRLDQSIILHSVPECLTRVDCSDLSVDHVARPGVSRDFRVLVAFSGVSRALAGSGFNTRVDECREAARRLFELSGGSAPTDAVLSEVGAEIFEQYAAELPGPLLRRATHYFTEQRRVLDGVEAWRRGDLLRFGKLMTASGESSIRNYECGTAELVTLFELLRVAPGVFGTRFSGAGFGGSCVALVEPEAGQAIVDGVSRRYMESHPMAAAKASFHLCSTAGGVRVTAVGK